MFTCLFHNIIGVRRLPLRQYELECLENYKIYNQYRGAVLWQLVSLVPWNYHDFGLRPHGNTVKLVPIPMVSPPTLSPLPLSNLGITVIAIPLQLSNTRA